MLSDSSVMATTSAKTLADLRPGQRARITGIAGDVQGLLRRRFLDLGFTRGAVVEVVLESAFGRGDPVAYRIRSTVIALRREQAERILIEPVQEEDGHEPEPDTPA